MAARQRNLRVRGLVKAMNQVRDGLRAGIEPEEESDFRHYVREVIASADRICKTNRITPADLPTPSWKAYEYLRSIDLEHLPRPTGERVIAEGSVRIPGILATCSRYHRTFRHIATSGVSDRERRTETGELARDLRSEAAAIEELCQTAGASPDALPTRSRRGYRWLSFLGDPANLERHVRALSVLEQAGNIKVGTEAQFRLFNTSMLYQTRTHGKRHEVLVN